MTEETTIFNKPVPKFASFRPKPEPPALSPPRGSSDSSKHTEDGQANAILLPESSTRHRHRKHAAPEHKSKRLRHLQSEDRRGEDSVSQVNTTCWKEPELYVVDVSGDTANVKYGSLHSYSVPSFFRSGYGNILGLSSSLKVNRQLSNDKYLVVSGPDNTGYLKRNKAAFAKVGRGRATKVKSITPAIELLGNREADFIPIDGGRTKKRRRLDDVLWGSGSNTDDEQHHYRSIEGKAKPSIDVEDSDIEFNEDASDLGQTKTLADEVMLHKAALTRKLDLEPGNGAAWLDLINYQGHILLGRSLDQRANAAETTSTADIKLSMYEKALNAVKDPELVEQLIIGMMHEGAKLWDVKKLANRWQNVLQENPHYINLWTKYLDFQQTNSASFHFDELREVYRKCLGILRVALLRAEGEVAKQDHLITIQLYLLLRLTVCLREAGYAEQSVAIWQVVFEFNLYRPSNSGNEKTPLSFEKLRISFEDFWESEVPRIGEENSVGWVNYSSHGGQPAEPKKDQNIPSGSQISLIKDWPKLEDTCKIQSQQPARTTDDTGENDPYRVVLFSDIKEFAFDVPVSGYRTLLGAFLAYCHLPPLENTPASLKPWWHDSFIRNDNLDGFKRLLHPSDPGEITTGRSTTDLFDLPLSSYAASTDSLFANHNSWFVAFHSQEPEYKSGRGSLNYSWTRRVLRTLVDLGISNDDLAEYFLAFEYNVIPTAARKTAKALLKKQPSKLRLYNSYALLEFRAGNRGTAEAVLAAAINLSKTLDNNAQKEAILLWRTWTWQLLEFAGTEDAVKRILTIPAIEIRSDAPDVLVNAATCLRAQKTLASGRDQALSLGEYRYAVLYSECLILLEYLTNGESYVDTTLSSYENHFQLFTSRLPPNSSPHELLHQSRAKLLYYHTTHTRSFKPALVRSTLTDSVKRFPHNTIFLSLYAWNEARFRIDDRVRALVHDVVLSAHADSNSSTHDIISHFFAVYVELRRSPTTGSNIHSIRGVLERAVESACGKQSAAMWKLYFLFECERGGLQRARAVFYRAIRACPWVKELYLLAFERLGQGMSVGELKGVYEMVVERELRVFVALEDAFEEVEGTV
ncbi:hypothetical protein MMC26_004197 [Xylographa opegraphella]|nr:hypothetical protein [Xylographa opegraphella]